MGTSPSRRPDTKDSPPQGEGKRRFWGVSTLNPDFEKTLLLESHPIAFKWGLWNTWRIKNTKGNSMQKTLFALISLLLVTACASLTKNPAAGQATWTPAPTYTFYPTYTPYPTDALRSSTSSSPTVSTSTAEAVVASFKAAGLEAENPRTMTKDDYGMAPSVCQGTRFFIPSLGPDNGGRIFICENQSVQAALAGYYQALGKSDATLFSWVFEKGNILVQINGDLPSPTAKKYESAIP